MKLAPRTFQIFWDVHAWAGIVGALVLHVLFFCGAFALFRSELTAWQEPGSTATPTPRAPLQPLVERVIAEHQLLGKDELGFTVEPGLPVVVEWHDATGKEQTLRLDPATATLAPARSELADFLYKLHFLYVFPGGLYVAGLFSVLLFLAITTGLLIQLKDFWRQLVQLRLKATLRVWVSDLHKVLGVFGIPFQLVIAWTGAVLCLSYVTIVPALWMTVFRGDLPAIYAEYGHPPSPPEAEKRPAPLPNVDAAVAAAQRLVPGLDPHWVGVHSPGDTAATVRVYGEVEGVTFGVADLLFRASDLTLLSGSHPGNRTASALIEQWVVGLHYAHFGGVGVRILYALFALASCAVMLSGSLIWLERRDPKRLHIGNRIVERLTVGAGAGLPLATGALFVANRLLPADLARRALWEQLVFAAVWAVALAVPFLRALSPRRMAGAQTLLAGVFLALVPLLDVALKRLHSLGVAAGLALLALLFLGLGKELFFPTRDNGIDDYLEPRQPSDVEPPLPERAGHPEHGQA